MCVGGREGGDDPGDNENKFDTGNRPFHRMNLVNKRSQLELVCALPICDTPFLPLYSSTLLRKCEPHVNNTRPFLLGVGGAGLRG